MSEKRRGRPPSPNKLSGAEKQRRWRAKHRPRSIAIAADTAATLSRLRELTGGTTDAVIRSALDRLEKQMKRPPKAGTADGPAAIISNTHNQNTVGRRRNVRRMPPGTAAGSPRRNSSEEARQASLDL